MSRELCMGNQALAFGALKAGVNVASGYPGTPSSEILETVSAYAVANGLEAKGRNALHVEWSTNEKAALEVGAGAAFAGARALVTMKQVGLNVASDALMTLPYLGVKGGLVLVVADDPGPISSQTEQDTRQYAQFSKVPLLDPSTPEEAFAMVQYAFDLSERYATPVIVRPTTRICHGTAPIETDFSYEPHTVDGFDRGPRWVIFPRRTFEGHTEIVERLSLIAKEFGGGCGGRDGYGGGGGNDTGDSGDTDGLGGAGGASSLGNAESHSGIPAGFTTVEDTHASAPAHFGIAAGGISYAYLHDALAQLTQTAAEKASEPLGPLRLLKVGTPFPFPEARALAFLEGLSEVLVFEELEPVIERELLQLAGKHHLPVRVLGKLTGHVAFAGESSVALIREQVAAFCGLDAPDCPGMPIDITPVADGAMAGAAVASGATSGAAAASVAEAPSAPELPTRPPVLCAGCPHRASFFAVKRALRGREAVFSGDIGCYTLGNVQPLDMVDTCVCMGAGLTVPQGMDWAQPDVAHLGFVGDSTFFASGLTGVANAAYNRANVTLCVLDNSTTAMTGSQPHPGTGIRIGAATSERDAENALHIPDVLCALGIEHVAEVNPFELDAAIAAVRAAVDFKGPSAIVFKAPCITVAAPRPQPTVGEDTCTGCGLCVKSIGCPALSMDGRRAVIDKTLCYGCGLCASVCPFDAINASPMPDGSGEGSSDA
jgi:indolepyruvate ferredoxin oxidoreductase alpha subunit